MAQKQQEDKQNTDAWKLKQEEKKRKKEAEMQGQTDQAAKSDKKQKKEKKKQQPKEEEKKEEKKVVKREEKLEEHIPKKQDQKKVKQCHLPQSLAPTYCKLIKIDELISPKVRESRIYHQQDLISKQMDQCLSKNDILLYIGDKVRPHECQQVYVQGMNNNTEAQLVCRYSDLSYFLQGSVTKIFIEAQYIFANGSILAKEGALNVALMGKYYNIPVVAVGGSWVYSGWAPLSHEALEEKYGKQGFKKLDWIEYNYLKSMILQVGVINPRQVSIYPPIIYKQLQLELVEW